MRLLVYGGVFDPVHKGHLALLAAAQKQIRPFKTLVVPSSDKTVHQKEPLFAADARLAMLKKALKNFPHTEILEHEIRSNAPTYTWETLSFLQKRRRGVSLYFLLGSDNIPSIFSWKNAGAMLGDPKIFFVVGRRKGFKNLNALGPKFLILNKIFPAVSSSALRRALLDPGGRKRRWAVNSIAPKAAGCLKDYAALICLARAYVKTHLPRQRCRHSLEVARLAKELARRHGLNENAAELAGLLHDASRFKPAFRNPQEALSHGPLSAKIARRAFGIKDKNILEAISRHTVGGRGMGKLARLVYVADLASYDRRFPEARVVRALARKNLDLALKKAVEVKIQYVLSQGEALSPLTIKLWKSL